MQPHISPTILHQWLTAWSLSRELSLPVKYGSGFKVDVQQEKQKARYVFAQPDDDFIRLANTITEPRIFLKVCAPPEEVRARIPDRWVVQPQGYMMICRSPMLARHSQLSNDYTLVSEIYGATHLLKIVDLHGETACTGRVVLVEGLAVYDRIVTTSSHRRKGLAAFLMKQLEKIARTKGATTHFLVATEEGRLLYQSLGWDLYCLYTSFVIPG